MARKVIVGGVGVSPTISKINASVKGIDGAMASAGMAVSMPSEYSFVHVKEVAVISKAESGYRSVPIDFSSEKLGSEKLDAARAEMPQRIDLRDRLSDRNEVMFDASDRNR